MASIRSIDVFCGSLFFNLGGLFACDDSPREFHVLRVDSNGGEKVEYRLG